MRLEHAGDALVLERVDALRRSRVAPKDLDLCFVVRIWGGRDAAEQLRGAVLTADPLATDDDLWAHELIGCEVRDLSGRVLGTVAEVLGGPGQPAYRVRGEREFLVPGVEPIVRRVDLVRRIIEVDLPEGLEDL